MKLPWIAPLAVAAAFAVSASAQDWKGTTGRLEGKVMDADGKPLVGATVKLELPERGGTALKTDKKGKWAILGLASGQWSVDVEADGFVTRRVTASVMQQTRIPPIDIRLEKAAPKGPPPEVAQAMEKADAAFKAGRLAEARAEYEKLLALRPELAARVHQQIGITYIQEKNYAKGLELLLKVLQAEPDNALIRAVAVQAAFDAGAPDKARELLTSLDDTKITSPDVFFNLGVNLLNAGATAQAVEFFGKAIARDPAYVDGYYRRGLGYLQLGKMTEARADFQKVVELAPGTPQAELARKALEQVK